MLVGIAAVLSSALVVVALGLLADASAGRADAGDEARSGVEVTVSHDTAPTGPPGTR